MRTEIQKIYEGITLGAAAMISACSAVLYYETTEHAKPYQKASGISANAWINFFAAKISIDYLATLCREKKYGKAAFVAFCAGCLYAPQVMIAILESTSSLDFTIFEATTTALAGMAIYAYSLIQLIGFSSQFARAIQHSLVYSLRDRLGYVTAIEKNNRATQDIIVRHLKNDYERLQFVNYRAANTTITVTQENALIAALQLAETIPPSFRHPKKIILLLQLMLQLGAATTLVYGSYGYMCATEKSLRKDLHVTPVTAIIGANILMFCQYALNAIAGFSLIASITQNVSAAIYYRAIPNDFKMGGKWGRAAASFAPLLAATMASFSGFTSKELYTQNCPTSFLRTLMFPHAGDVIDYSARFFNAIYDTKALYWFLFYLMAYNGSTADRHFLTLQQSLNTFINDIKATPFADVDTDAESTSINNSAETERFLKSSAWTLFHALPRTTKERLQKNPDQPDQPAVITP